MVDIDYGSKDSSERGHKRIVDFTNIMPDFPLEGIIVASSDHTDQDHQHAIG